MPKLEVLRNHAVVTNLAELLTQVRDARDNSPTAAVWLRGLSDPTHHLVPTIGREYWFAGRPKVWDRDAESRLLHQFGRYAFQFFGRALTDWETILVARHHGLPVRLLDWTSDPLAALYFACEFRTGGTPPDGKVWLLIPTSNMRHHLDVFKEPKSPLKIGGIKLVYPMVVAQRINAQSGLFTIQPDPHKPLDQFEGTDFKTKDLDVLRLVELVVPGPNRAQILKDLNDLGVNRRSLFPDLDGLSEGLVTSYILRG